MALSFPLSLAELSNALTLVSVEWSDNRQEATSDLGSGEFLVHSRGPVLVEAAVTVRPHYLGGAEAIRARLRRLDGSQQAFYLTNPLLPFPQSDPDGSVLGASTPDIDSINSNRKALVVSGLPPSYVLSIGDWAHIDYGSPARRAIVQVVEAATASAGGVTPEFEVRPHLRPGVMAGDGFVLARPAAKVKIIPGSLRLASAGLLTTVSFTARQTLEAD